MKIVAKQVNSFVDFPSNIAYVVFTAGCNMDCWYCHNRSFLDCKEFLDEEEILQDIYKRKGFIDGVVVSGGEPTLQNDLIEFISKIKTMGLKIKLDTNGSRPEVLKELLDRELLDFVAMDIKAPFEKYGKVTCVKDDIAKIKQSINTLMTGSVDYEFRTTFCPELSEDDILTIAKEIKGAKLYALQQFIDHPEFNRKTFMSHSAQFIKDTAQACSQYVKTITRGL